MICIVTNGRERTSQVPSLIKEKISIFSTVDLICFHMVEPLRDGITKLREEGVKSLFHASIRYGFSHPWLPVWNTVTSRYPIGTNIFDRDWDLLVVLDACRADSLARMSGSLPWLTDVDQMQSVGSTSPEWVIKTFTEDHLDEIENTAFISRNVWSQRIFDEKLYLDHKISRKKEYDHIRRGYPNWKAVGSEDFKHYERVQPIGNQDDRIHPESTSIPHIVTDRAITVGREMDFDRLIVWYRIPHIKFIADAIDWTAGETSMETLMNGPEVTRDLEPEERTYDAVRNGDASPEKVRELYHKNLRFVLEYVDILFENIDAENAVVSADHGEGLGNGWGKFWSHPYGYPFSPIKTVPWAKTTATDEQTYEPQYDELDRNPIEDEQRQLLKDMGYI